LNAPLQFDEGNDWLSPAVLAYGVNDLPAALLEDRRHRNTSSGAEEWTN
jgi:hypothetical protein